MNFLRDKGTVLPSQALRPVFQLQGSRLQPHGVGVDIGGHRFAEVTHGAESVIVTPSLESEMRSGRVKPQFVGQVFWTMDTGRFYIYTGEEVKRAVKPNHQRWVWWPFWKRRGARMYRARP